MAFCRFKSSSKGDRPCPPSVSKTLAARPEVERKPGKETPLTGMRGEGVAAESGPYFEQT